MCEYVLLISAIQHHCQSKVENNSDLPTLFFGHVSGNNKSVLRLIDSPCYGALEIVCVVIILT